MNRGLLLFLVSASVFSVGCLGLWWYLPGPQPPWLQAQPHPPQSNTHLLTSPRPSSPRHLTLAGSGSNLPWMRLLVRTFNRQNAKNWVLKVSPSIGSTGGIRAARDGVIDLGLISRPLRPKERRWGLTVRPYARVPVVFAAHAHTPLSNLTTSTLLALYAGKQRTWPNGQPVRILQRERGDSSHLAVSRKIPAFARVNASAYRAHRWRVLYKDQAMLQALLTLEGSLGLTDLGVLSIYRLPLKRLSWMGIPPSIQNVQRGQYPFWKQLSFVYKTPLPPLAKRFLQYVFGANGQQLMRRYGYLPIPLKGGSHAPQ